MLSIFLIRSVLVSGEKLQGVILQYMTNLKVGCLFIVAIPFNNTRRLKNHISIGAIWIQKFNEIYQIFKDA
jgi:hypothetical protein